MTPIEQLEVDLRQRFPGLVLEVDAPADRGGVWQLDVRPQAPAPWVVIEWRPDLGFGVSTPVEEDYGTKPDAFFPSKDLAYDRVLQLISTSGKSQSEPWSAVRPLFSQFAPSEPTSQPHQLVPGSELGTASKVSHSSSKPGISPIFRSKIRTPLFVSTPRRSQPYPFGASVQVQGSRQRGQVVGLLGHRGPGGERVYLLRWQKKLAAVYREVSERQIRY